MKTRTAIAALAALAILGSIIALIIFLAKTQVDGSRAVSSDEVAPPSEAPRAPIHSRPSASAIKPRPFSESEPVEAATNAAGVLEVEVIGSAGKPASKARLVLHRLEVVLGTASTDDHGMATFAVGEGEAVLLAVPDGAPAYATTIPIHAGRQRIQLPAGASIAGRVEVNGGLPPEPVKLRFAGADSQLVMEMWEALKGETTATATTAASGAFEFAGAPAGSEWRILPSIGYRVDGVFSDDKLVLAVTAPAQGIVVKVTRLPIVRGRVVAEDRKTPLVGATCTSKMIGPLSTMTRTITVDDDGTFRFCAGNETDSTVRYTRLEIIVRGPRRIGERTVVLDPLPERDHDLGDIPMSGGRAVRFIVRDQAGAPIEAAFACLADGRVEPSTRTDAQGQGVILLGKEARSFRVGALRHEIAEVAVPDPLPDLLPVTLNPTTGLVVAIEAPAVSRFDAFLVRMSSSASDILGAEELGNDPIREAGGASASSLGSIDDRGARLHFVPGPDWRVVVAGIKPATPFMVELVDALGQVHASASVTLAAGEWKTVGLRLTQVARSLRGRVRDPFGQPVPGARIEIAAVPPVEKYLIPPDIFLRNDGDAGHISVLTDSEGRFLLPAIYASVVDLAVHKTGFSALLRPGLAVPSDPTSEVDLVLQKGCELKIVVVDSGGSPLSELVVFAEVAGFPKESGEEMKDPGVYVFADFPVNVTATIGWEWANRDWSRKVAVKGDLVERIVMPATGTLVVDWSAIQVSNVLTTTLTPTSSEQRPTGRFIEPLLAGSTEPRELTITTLLAGEYRLSVQHRPAMESPEMDPAARPEQVTVKAGETTRVVLRKP